MKTFSIREALRFGWDAFKKYPWQYIAVMIVMMAVNYVTRHVPIVNIISGLISILMAAGLIRISLNALDHHKPKVNDLFVETGHYWRFLGGAILLGVIAVLPMLVAFLLSPIHFRDLIGAFHTHNKMAVQAFFMSGAFWLPIIIGIIGAFLITIRYSFVSYLIIDRNSKINDAFKKSAHMVSGNFGKLIAFKIAAMLVFLVGFACLGVGILIAIPVIAIASAYVYRRLLSHHETSSEHHHHVEHTA